MGLGIVGLQGNDLRIHLRSFLEVALAGIHRGQGLQVGQAPWCQAQRFLQKPLRISVPAGVVDNGTTENQGCASCGYFLRIHWHR